MRVAVGYDGAVRDITDFDGVRSRWKLKRTEILREYSSDVETLVEGTSQLLEDKEKFVHSLFGGYGSTSTTEAVTLPPARAASEATALT